MTVAVLWQQQLSVCLFSFSVCAEQQQIRAAVCAAAATEVASVVYREQLLPTLASAVLTGTAWSLVAQFEN